MDLQYFAELHFDAVRMVLLWTVLQGAAASLGAGWLTQPLQSRLGQPAGTVGVDIV